MHCVQFEMRLNHLLDDRRDPDSDLELAEHARECPCCAELLFGHEMLLRGVEMRMLDEPTAGRDLAVRVAAEVAGGSRRSSWRHWSWTIPTVAASLLLAFAVWHRVGGIDDSARPNDRSITKDGIPTAPPITSHRGPSYDGIYRRTAEWTQELRPPEWVEQMADGLKPVADSMSAALHGLRRTLTGAEPAVRSSQFEPLTLSRVAAIG
jgi:hypothetical protein